MQTVRPFVFTTLLVCLAALGACGSSQPADAGSSGPLAAGIDHALDGAKQKLHTKNITISNVDDAGDTLPKAEITPQGDLLIAGKAVSIDARQRTLLLDYRKQVIEIAEQGIDVGKRGAALGLHAASEALAAAFSGQSEQEIRERIEARTSDIREAAAQICNRLPAMRARQQELAAALPAFKPYARMTQQDVDDCYKETRKDHSD